MKQIVTLQTKCRDDKEHYLAILPGKPKCRVTSMCPTSIPNSRAFVAATPQSFPPKKSLSILLRSCSHRQTMSKQNKQMPVLLLSKVKSQIWENITAQTNKIKCQNRNFFLFRKQQSTKLYTAWRFYQWVNSKVCSTERNPCKPIWYQHAHIQYNAGNSIPIVFLSGLFNSISELP